jgi:hypothetical protein
MKRAFYMIRFCEMTPVSTELFRGMKKGHDGRPLVGLQSNMLGARVPGDIEPDAIGFVHPNSGGDLGCTGQSKASPYSPPSVSIGRDEQERGV